MKRKLFITLCISVMLAFCLCFSVACFDFGCAPEEEITNGKISLSSTSIQMEVYETATLKATLKDIDGEVVWSSSDQTIATVSNGEISAKKVGVATITASVGDLSATTTVTVNDAGYIPNIVFKDIDDYELSILDGSSYQLVPTINYNGKEYSDATFTFSAGEKNSIFSVDAQGVITALQTGQSILTISASWRDYINPIIKTVAVIVRENLSVVLGGQTQDLYCVTEVDDQTFINEQQLSFEAFDGGEKISVNANDIEWIISDTSIAEIQGNKIVAKKAGQVEVIACYTFASGTTVSSIPTSFIIEKPFVQKDLYVFVDTWIDNGAYIRNKTDVTIDGNMIFDNGSVVSILDVASNEEYSVSQGVIKEYKKLGKGEKEVIVFGEQFGYKIKICLVDMLLENFNDLQILSKMVTDGKFYNGHYVLNSNINYYGLNFPVNTEVAFNGTFDGNGYSISNIQFSNGFVFTLSSTGVIKNLAFLDVSYKNDAMGATFAMLHYGTIENCYAQINFAEGQINSGGLVHRAYPNSLIKDSVVRIIGEDPRNCGAFGKELQSGAKIKNSFAIVPDLNEVKYASYNLGGDVDGDQNASDRTNCAIYASVDQFMATVNNDYNSFTSLEEIKVDCSNVNTLTGGVLIANAPVKWTVAESGAVVDEKGNISIIDKSLSKINITATYLFDTNLTEQLTIDVQSIDAVEFKQYVLEKKSSIKLDTSDYPCEITKLLDCNGQEVAFVKDGSNLIISSSVFADIENVLYFEYQDKYYQINVDLYDYVIDSKDKFIETFVNKVNNKDLQNNNNSLSSTYALSVDIDASDITVCGWVNFINGTLANGIIFSGTINGYGHSITGLTVQGGMFYQFSGRVKNIAFKEVNLTHMNKAANDPYMFGAVLGYVVRGNAKVENVYFDVKIVSSSLVHASVIGITVESGNNLSLTKVVVNMDTNSNSPTGIGMLVWDNSGTVNITDSYAICANSNYDNLLWRTQAAATLKYGTTTLTGTKIQGNTSILSDYCYVSYTAFNSAVQSDVFTGIMWEGVFNGLKTN